MAKSMFLWQKLLRCLLLPLQVSGHQWVQTGLRGVSEPPTSARARLLVPAAGDLWPVWIFQALDGPHAFESQDLEYFSSPDQPVGPVSGSNTHPSLDFKNPVFGGGLGAFSWWRPCASFSPASSQKPKDSKRDRSIATPGQTDFLNTQLCGKHGAGIKHIVSSQWGNSVNISGTLPVCSHPPTLSLSLSPLFSHLLRVSPLPCFQPDSPGWTIGGRWCGGFRCVCVLGGFSVSDCLNRKTK